MKIFKKTIHILSYICYIFIGLYAIVCVPLLLKWKPVVVLTGSMEPTYKVGSVIYYKQVPKEEIVENDVVTFKLSNGQLVTHRINKIENDKYVTKGDANESVDPEKITFDRIQGKIQKLNIPFIGYYINFIQHHMYFLIIVMVILVLEFLLSNIKNKKEVTNE